MDSLRAHAASAPAPRAGAQVAGVEPEVVRHRGDDALGRAAEILEDARGDAVGHLGHGDEEVLAAGAALA